ncbi:MULTISPECIES: hypothetical protein [Bradyrhizobium]|uniref:hypothetical protein n=1 Tax=Bradyrhizobium TaxID=374 RepID=UPI00155E1E34|nr:MULTISPECIES: hypothetical protein [Bradyrhizobium]MDD1519182.1 hypothetical protein [Bradyrhizobium sp. WBAH30]MDD1543426.1 hypothetical protein [Bradyrhizobium sp. WBAH41]MDD1557556.1 hypothetical protein [Bradyrhizobium sp. WBAH23]MDD1564968.1 hypothetical protein [Bradyrhizobium sp. WBAH33]MDD1590376.1 hypothetical protein [Bradyrhizobium sp. WBAH42]
MSLAYFALIVSVVSASALDIAGATFGAQLGTLAAALGLLAAAFSARKADYEHYVRATSWGRWILVAIPLCIAAQLAPLPLRFAHPIWASAHEVIGGLSLGPITADIGLTVNALLLALAAISLLGVAILVVRNRIRAELVLFVLSGVTAISALMLDLHRLSPALAATVPHDLTASLAGLGLMLNLAVMQLAAERAETHHSIGRSIAIGLCGLVGALVSAAAIFGLSGTNSAIAAAFGVVLILLILVIRRLDLSRLAASALSIAALAGAAIVLTFLFEKSSGPILLRLVPEMGAETKAAFERMLADTRWFGAGAGTFAAVGRIYQSDASAVLTTPSAAISVFAGMGWVGLIAMIAVSLLALVRLFFGALQRGRDSFFPASAAACVLFALVQSFAGPGLLHPAAILCLSVIVGLGLSQSVSQSGSR